MLCSESTENPKKRRELFSVILDLKFFFQLFDRVLCRRTRSKTWKKTERFHSSIKFQGWYRFLTRYRVFFQLFNAKLDQKVQKQKPSARKLQEIINQKKKNQTLNNFRHFFFSNTVKTGKYTQNHDRSTILGKKNCYIIEK